MAVDPPKADPKGVVAVDSTANGGPALGSREDQSAKAGGCCGSRDRVRRCIRANLLVLLTVAASAEDDHPAARGVQPDRRCSQLGP